MNPTLNNDLPPKRTCSYETDRMEELIICTTEIAKEIKVLTGFHREMTRWLLGVVCVIALGNKALDLAQALAKTSNASAEEVPQNAGNPR